MTGFNSTCAVISGGASGLGLAVAKRIIQQGGRAAILDINEQQGRYFRLRKNH